MITITSAEIRTTSTGKEYKLLSLADGKKVSIWGDDEDYEIARQGTVLERELYKKGDYWNLSKKEDAQPSKDQRAANIQDAQLNSIWWLLRKIADKLEVEYQKDEEKDLVKSIQDKYDYNLDPLSVPF